MISVRKSEDRGKANFGWLDAKYSFSFSNYYDPEHTGFRDLLVLNQDTIEPDGGFGMHPHKDMEIVTYIIEGEIEHKDSIGNVGVIKKGEIQRMSAGTGIVHSEYNPSGDQQTKLLQIWIKPAALNQDPGYENREFGTESGFNLLVSPNGDEGSAKINQDVYFYGAKLSRDEKKSFELGENRHAWIQVVKGNVSVNGQILDEGDGAKVSDVTKLDFEAKTDSEFLLINLK